MVCRASLAAAISPPAPGNKLGWLGLDTTGVEVADETKRLLAVAAGTVSKTGRGDQSIGVRIPPPPR